MVNNVKLGHIQCDVTPLRAWGPPFFISNLDLSYHKYLVDKVWTKIYCRLYYRGITL